MERRRRTYQIQSTPVANLLHNNYWLRIEHSYIYIRIGNVKVSGADCPRGILEGAYNTRVHIMAVCAITVCAPREARVYYIYTYILAIPSRMCKTSHLHRRPKSPRRKDEGREDRNF